MEFSGLKAQYNCMSEEMKQAVCQVLEDGQYILGPQVKRLEERLCEYTGRKYCLGVSSGTDALLLALLSEGIGPGDCVFTTAFSFFATAEVIALAGAQPVFVDINPLTYNIDPYCLSHAIKRVDREGLLRPRAVIAVDIFGLPADYEKIEEICAAAGLVLIEDAAQSFGASIGSRKCCSFGSYAATSFFPSKPLGCYGDGGAVFCDDATLYERLCSLRVHGQGQHKYHNLRVGLNARLDEMQAAILNIKLDHFAHELTLRRQVAEAYSKRLSGYFKLPAVPTGLTCAFAQYTIAGRDTPQRDYLKAGLEQAGIPCHVYYPVPLHMQPAFQGLTYHAMPNALEASGRVLSLPMHPYLTIEEQDAVCTQLLRLLDEEKRPE